MYDVYMIYSENIKLRKLFYGRGKYKSHGTKEVLWLNLLGGVSMIPRFSLKYGDEFFNSDNLSCEKKDDGLLYALDEEVTVTLTAKEYYENHFAR